MEQVVVDWKGQKAFGIPYSRAHVWRMMEAGPFPQSFKLGMRRNSHPVRWIDSIENWLEAHAQAKL